MTLSRFWNLEDEILSTNPEPLKAIKIGIVNKNGSVDHVITLEELARVGSSQPLQMHNYANFGEVEYEFTIPDAGNISGKVAYLREQQEEQQRGEDY